MTLIVCSLEAVGAEIASARPARILSLLSPTQDAPPTSTGVHHLVLRFHDVAAPTAGLVEPDDETVTAILAFGAAWCEPAPMLVHCWMGISRSPAAALALACALTPDRDEQDLAATLRQASPTATPNPMIIASADRLLGRQGRLVAAAQAIGRGAEAARGQPFRFRVRSPA